MQTDVSATLVKHPPFAGISFEVGEPDSQVQRGAAHDRLRACIGEWRASGELDAGGEMHCLESYSWVPGEFFIEYRFDRDVGGGKKHAGLGLIGYDAARDEYFAFFVDNLGNPRTYEVTLDGSTWMFIGKFERATISFEPERNRMNAHWEHSSDGRQWKLLCEYGGARTAD
jgi:hypothetical protein